MGTRGREPREREEGAREERGQRILDAALALILRWGYGKTTIDDISRQAGVAKGTIYLHWKTREDLFDALIRRERVIVGEDIQRRITSDPEGWTLRGIVKYSALATMKRPLLRALFMGDRDVLGRLADLETSTAAFAERLAGFRAYLELLREHGLIRTDLTLEEEVNVVSAALAGFFFTAKLMPREYALPDETQASLMADMVHRTLESDRSVSPDEYCPIFAALTGFVERTTDTARQHSKE